MPTYAHPEQAAPLPEALANINSKVLDDRALKRILNPEIFTAFAACRASGQRMSKGAANELAQKLSFVRNENPIVLGLPNEGVPMAATIAHSLDAALDILLIAKLSMPDRPKQIVGAVDEHGRISMIQSAARLYHVTAQELIAPAREAFTDLQRRRARFRAVLPETDVRGRTVIIVDQGVETGATMLGAIASVRDRGARRVVVAAPAGTGKGTWQLHETADGVGAP